MPEDIIKKIREAEEEAERKIKNTEKAGEKILIELEEWFEQELEKLKEEEIEKLKEAENRAKEKGKEIEREIRLKTEREIKTIQEKVKGKEEKVKELVIKKIESLWGLQE